MADEHTDGPAITQPEQSQNIYALLATRARAASDGRLVADASLGTIALAVAIFVHPHWWALLLPLVSIGALGFWGIADRELGAPVASPLPAGRRRRALVIAQGVAVVVGTCAAVVAGAMFMVVALGRIIS